MPTTMSIRKRNRLPLTLLALIPANLAAEPVSLELDYSCVFPILEEQPLAVRLRADIPNQVQVGQTTEPFQIEATASVSETSWNGLNFVGGSRVSGDVVAEAGIRGPALDLDLSIPLQITETDLPEVRTSFEVAASGSTPPLIFSEQNVGELDISVGNIVMNLEATDANGKLTGLGPIESECRLTSGQPALLQTLTVTNPDSSQPPLHARGDGRWQTPETGTDIPLAASFTATPGDPSGETIFSLENSSVTIPVISLFNTLSISTDLRFEPAGDASAEQNGDTLTVTAPLAVALPRAELRLFGLKLSDGGSEDCRTREPATLSVSSADNSWDDNDPFNLKGTLDIPEFQGCGNVTRLINRYLSGSGQPVELRMTPVSDDIQ